MDNSPIGIFDSGVGAFSVLNQLTKILPNENYIYFGDSGHNPYGQKDISDLQKLCKCITEFLIDKKVKAIVIACNTATAASLSYLNEIFKDIDIIGVIEPGAKEAVKLTKNKKVGVCATCFTANSHAYKNAINKIDKNIEVREIGSKDLANIIENGFEHNEKNYNLIKDFIYSVDGDVDTIVLGCTHYPLVRSVFEKYFDKTLVDPGMETALEMKNILEKKDILSNNKNGFSVKYFTTTNPDKFKNAAKNLTNLNIDDVTEVNLDDRLLKEGLKI